MSKKLDFLNKKTDSDSLLSQKALNLLVFDRVLVDFHPDFQTVRFQTLVRGFAQEVSIPLLRWYIGDDKDELAVDFKTMCDLHQKIVALIKSYWSTDDGEGSDNEEELEEVDDEEKE